MFRPSHADYTYQAKYGIRNWQGGARLRARSDRSRGRRSGGEEILQTLYPGLEILALRLGDP